jgi:hypothetical protein
MGSKKMYQLSMILAVNPDEIKDTIFAVQEHDSVVKKAGVFGQKWQCLNYTFYDDAPKKQCLLIFFRGGLSHSKS